jgi:hypothetical protein
MLVVAMFERVNQWYDQRKAAKLIRKHMALASGSHFQRNMIAVSMAAIEDDLVQKERSKLPLAEQNLFMMAYECFLMWALKKGIDSVLNSEESASAITAMQGHFKKHGWYVVGNFEKIWDEMQKIAPLRGTRNGVIWPVADLMNAVDQAGFRLAFPLDYRFGAHVLCVMRNLIDVGSFAAKQQGALETRKSQTLLESSERVSAEIVVSGFRQFASQNRCAPTANTSDEKIIEIYSKVTEAFTAAAEHRGERIPAGCLNRIVMEFLQMYEFRFENEGKPGLDVRIAEKFLWEHLQYEVKKYLAEGLRPDYKHELPFF